MSTNTSAIFDYQILNDVVVIFDLNLGANSVTDDIVSVLESIVKDIGDFNGKRIIYRDSCGRFDGVAITNTGHFFSFFTLNERTLAAAMKKLNRYIH